MSDIHSLILPPAVSPVSEGVVATVSVSEQTIQNSIISHAKEGNRGFKVSSKREVAGVVWCDDDADQS